jgi:hypothetical protein
LGMRRCTPRDSVNWLTCPSPSSLLPWRLPLQLHHLRHGEVAAPDKRKVMSVQWGPKEGCAQPVPSDEVLEVQAKAPDMQQMRCLPKGLRRSQATALMFMAVGLFNKSRSLLGTCSCA